MINNIKTEYNYYVVSVNNIDVKVEKDYDPLKDSGQYMNTKQRAYFKVILIKWLNSLKESMEEGMELMSSSHMDIHSVDEADIASIEAEIISNLRTKDRQRKLMY